MKHHSFWVLMCVALLLSVQAQAVRYMGDPKDIPPLENLINILKVQYQQLEKIMSLRDELDGWKTRLDKESRRLAEESERAKQDRNKMESGEMSDSELNDKWHQTGRSLKHDRELKGFKEDVARFNERVREYNDLTKKMDHVIGKRSPQQVLRLINDMQELERVLTKSLEKGDIIKAKFIAKESDVAAEFGYVAR